MRIGLDIRYLTHGLTGGVATYVQHLAAWLPRVAPDLSFVYYGDGKSPLAEPLPSSPNVTVRLLPWRSPVTSLVNDWRIGRMMAADAVDIAHFPGNYGPRGPYRLVVTVHDTYNLFPLREHLRGFGRHPRQVAMMAYLGRRTRRALVDADVVLTCSEHARTDLARRTGRALETIVAVHHGVGDAFSAGANAAGDRLAALRAAHALAPQVVLADGIKNPEALVAAWERLPEALRTSTTLVFFSREPKPRPAVAAMLADPARRAALRFIPRPSTSDLASLMQLATVFAFPTFHEGFGLPLVEAMQSGLPIVASTRGSVPEIVGDAALLFEVDDHAALAAALARVLSDRELRERLRARGRARATTFTWERAARRAAAVYRSLGEPGRVA